MCVRELVTPVGTWGSVPWELGGTRRTQRLELASTGTCVPPFICSSVGAVHNSASLQRKQSRDRVPTWVPGTWERV